MWNIGPLKSSDIYSRAAEEKKQKWMPKYAKNKKLEKYQTYIIANDV